MTCIVGIEHAGGVTIGVDSAGSDGLTISIRDDSKLFRVGGYLFGFTTSFRMGQLLRYSLRVGEPDSWDVDRFMATTFVEAVRKTLREGGFATTRDGAEAGGTFLVGVAGRLYTVFGDYQVGHDAAGYDAVGSGARPALGSLHTTSRSAWATLGLDSADIPAHRVELALEAAAACTTSVAGPFHIDTLEA